MQTAQGSLVLVGVDTATPTVHWNGAQVPFITGIRVDWEADEQRIKLKVSAEDASHAELRAAGIAVKLEGAHHG